MRLVKPIEEIKLLPATTAPADFNRNVRDAAVVTAVHVARDWAIETHGNGYSTPNAVVAYMQTWLIRNGAKMYDCAPPQYVITQLVEAVWALAELPGQDPLTFVDDDYRGTSDEARAMLTAQYERDLQHALSRITWKA